MYWHEDCIVYFVEDFENKKTWKKICTCEDEETADYIRNVLDFAEEGYKETKENFGRAVSDIRSAENTIRFLALGILSKKDVKEIWRST